MNKDLKKIYFIGIGGIGMSALARLYSGLGKTVFGSDMKDSGTVQDLVKLGVDIKVGHDPVNIENASPDSVVYSEDISEGSLGFKELSKAKELGISCITYAQALGQMMQGHYSISVTGTNGKSTTTAILGLILEAAGLDPLVVVGSKLSEKNSNDKFKANARLGSGKYFVAEADEYHRHMMDQKPNLIVITNVAEDHLDYYKDIDEIKHAFISFVKTLPEDGAVIFNADDHMSLEVGREAQAHKLTFGIHHYADLQAINLKFENGKQSFDLHFKDENLGRVEINLPGLFNISNVLGAVLAAIHLGVSFEVIKKALADFAGIWRRFEIVGKLDRTTIVSDYAHHPAGVLGTIEASKQFFPNQKILFVFQPHHRNRTKRLFGEFVESMATADDIILPEIFDVPGREHGETVSSKDLATELKKLQVNAEFATDLNEAEQQIRDRAKNFGAVVLMGAGDIDALARKLSK